MDWRKSKGSYPPGGEIQFLSSEQFFFVAYAQTWCEVRTEKSAQIRLLTDPHAPPRFRVLGPLSNFVPFQEAFSCANTANMVAEERCDLWFDMYD